MSDSNDKQYILDRADAVPSIIGEHKDFLIVTGLAGASQELAHLTNDADHLFTMAGAMGAACATGLGLALAQPDRKVLVVTGDGELLMNIGSLATIAVLNPPNLSILCVDNGHYGETGYQKSHTSLGVDLETVAQGSGIKATRTVQTESEIADGARVLRESNASSFIVLRVKPTNPPKIKRNMRASECRARFRHALL
ncbi:MAG: thiamine pyrophosphate-dependent acetolactate synthase large subunit-like protein [Gammaproteobacteria bacterium]|jgi:thiamine pyrophosphate-dependent acetolactate synthase large subunit-like protein